MQERIRPLDRNHLSVLVAVLLLGSVLFRFVELPEHVWRLEALGSDLEIRVTGVWLLVTLMVGVVCTGTNYILRDHPHVNEHPGRPVYIAWILPGVAAGLAGYLLANAATWFVWVGGLVLLGVGISLTIAAEYTAVCADSPGYPTARMGLSLLAYLLVFSLFTIIYRSRARSLVTATLTTLVAALLSLDLLSVADVHLQRVFPFAGIVGLIVGESTWVLNYWQIDAWVGGLFLLLIFYVIVNAAHQHLLSRLKAVTFVEFAVVTAAVLAIVLLNAP